jgi:ribosomal protein S18 acetylase RimI-like enzyme
VSLASADPGYGYVSDDIPELSLTVFEHYRRRGFGRALLAQVMEEAERRGFSALSLSVEDGNPSRGLYESAGFRIVGRNGASDTMLLRFQ